MDSLHLLERITASRLLEVLFLEHGVSTAAEIAVILLAVSRSRTARSLPATILHRLSRDAEADLSGWWALPLYLWCFEKVFVVSDLFFSPRGLTSPDPMTFYYIYYYEMVALSILVVTQHLAVLALGGRPLSLGLKGRTRAAVHYVLLDLLVLGFLFFSLQRWLHPRGL